jgi:hypothetical protein
MIDDSADVEVASLRNIALKQLQLNASRRGLMLTLKPDVELNRLGDIPIFLPHMHAVEDAGPFILVKKPIMRAVVGKQSTFYVTTRRPKSLAALKVGSIMHDPKEIDMHILESTTVADLFKFIQDNADDIDAKIGSSVFNDSNRSVKNGFLVCYESNKNPPFQILTMPSSTLISSLGVTSYGSDGYYLTQAHVWNVQPTLYIFARARGEGKHYWYITTPPRGKPFWCPSCRCTTRHSVGCHYNPARIKEREWSEQFYAAQMKRRAQEAAAAEAKTKKAKRGD